MSNFIEQCQAQAATYDDIDDFIDEWHENPDGKSLHDFLGMTRYEYSLWLTDSSILPTIVGARSRHQSIDELLEEFKNQLPPVANAPGPATTQELIEWLKKQEL